MHSVKRNKNKKIYKKEKQKRSNYLHHDCQHILMLLYIVLAYLILFAALFNAVCLYNAFLDIDFFKCFLFSCFILGY